MKRLSMILACLAVIMMAAQAQKVTLFSPEFELGVRQHLGLDANVDVLQSQTDTITSIDLSGLGLRDIRDVVYLTAVEELDLSYNQLWDVSPLLSLDSLRYVDVSYNMLESVSILAMAQVDSLLLDVTNNYIEDFSYFFTPTLCWFNIIGMDLQLVKDAPYFDVYTFYAAVNEKGRNTLTYRGYTNMHENPYVDCNAMHRAAQLDGGTQSVLISGRLTGATLATLSNGVYSDSTWVLPAADFDVAPGASLHIVTGLPQSYDVVSAFTSRGTTFVSGTDITYMAPITFVADTIFVGYSENGRMRGYTRYCLYTPGSHAVLSGDTNGDGMVDVQDVITLIDQILGKEPENFNLLNADMNGDGYTDAIDVVMLIDVVLGRP